MESLTRELVDIIESHSVSSTNDGRYAPVWKPGLRDCVSVQWIGVSRVTYCLVTMLEYPVTQHRILGSSK